MAESEMVERVARAIALGHDYRNYDDISGHPAWAMYVGHAKLVIEAMRSPTLAMLKAGDLPGWDDMTSIGLSNEVWEAMIDASLKP